MITAARNRFHSWIQLAKLSCRRPIKIAWMVDVGEYDGDGDD